MRHAGTAHRRLYRQTNRTAERNNGAGVNMVIGARQPDIVTPAQAGVQDLKSWMPVCAGMTGGAFLRVFAPSQ